VVVQGLLERTLQLVAESARSRGVTVTLDAPTAALELRADGAKLQQVLLNLAQNAIEALGSDGGEVVLRARRQPRTITLEVEDGGPGVPPDAPIFDAFFSTRPQGTGLGLSITHRIVTDHGGSIAVESRPGHTVFRVVLPIEGPQGGPARRPEG
jgi:signal transduction histidine kinase